MQNKHHFSPFLGIPTFGEGGRGGGSSRLGPIPNFYRKFVFGASLRLIFQTHVMEWCFIIDIFFSSYSFRWKTPCLIQTTMSEYKKIQLTPQRDERRHQGNQKLIIDQYMEPSWADTSDTSVKTQRRQPTEDQACSVIIKPPHGNCQWQWLLKIDLIIYQYITQLGKFSTRTLV